MSVLLVLENPDGGIEKEDLVDDDFYDQVMKLGWRPGELIRLGSDGDYVRIVSMDERTFLPNGEVREIHVAIPTVQ